MHGVDDGLADLENIIHLTLRPTMGRMFAPVHHRLVVANARFIVNLLVSGFCRVRRLRDAGEERTKLFDVGDAPLKSDACTLPGGVSNSARSRMSHNPSSVAAATTWLPASPGHGGGSPARPSTGPICHLGSLAPGSAGGNGAPMTDRDRVDRTLSVSDPGVG